MGSLSGTGASAAGPCRVALIHVAERTRRSAEPRYDVVGIGNALVDVIAHADDVFVQVFTASQAEGEPAVGQDLHGGRLLGDDRGVIPHGRTRHIGVEVDPLGGLRHGTQHRPGVRRVSLCGEPRREVVAAHVKVEAALFGRNRILDKVFGSTLLGHQSVAKIRHA